jgi:hypothetical protein
MYPKYNKLFTKVGKLFFVIFFIFFCPLIVNMTLDWCQDLDLRVLASVTQKSFANALGG